MVQTIGVFSKYSFMTTKANDWFWKRLPMDVKITGERVLRDRIFV